MLSDHWPFAKWVAWPGVKGDGLLVFAAGGGHMGGMSAQICVNGESRPYPDQLSVAGLIDRLGLDTRKVAVERNEAIVPRSSYADTWLAAGDRLEIVHFIGGG